MARHRGHNEGSIFPRRRADGRITGYQVQVLLPDGRRRTLGTVKTRREALKLVHQGQVDVAAGKLVSTPRQSLATYLTDWLEAKRPSIRYKTHVTYRTAINHATRLIGDVRLDALRPAHVEACERRIREGQGARTAEQVHTVLHAALRRAVQLDLIQRNPTEAVIAPRPKRSERPSLTLDQAQTLFEATRDDRLHALYVLLTTAGLRLGAALGLEWQSVDLDGGTIQLRQELQRQTGRGFVIEELKTVKSRRMVPLTRIAREALRAHQKSQGEHARLLGREWHHSKLVFTSVVGTPLDPANVRRHYYLALETAGLPRVRLHDLRHTASSLMASQGIPLHVIQAILGHSTSATTADVYIHVLPDSYRDATRRMDEAFESESHDG